MIRVIRFLMPALGLLLLGYLIGRLGPEATWRNLSILGWRFLLVLGVACTWHVSNSIAWACAFPPDAFRPPLRTLFMAKLAGEAVNQLTPLANLGGEPLKAYLLRMDSPASRGMASVVINKMGQAITGLLFATMGLSLVILYWTLPQAIPAPVQLGIGTLLLCSVLLVLFIWRRQSRMFSSLFGFLRRLGLPIQAVEERFAQADRIDRSIGQFYHRHGLRFGLVLLFHSIGWLLGVVETLVILHGLGADASFAGAFLITSLSAVINALFFFMPSNIGVMEGGQVFLLMTLGLDPAMGLALGITKRMRKIFWIMVGWLFLARLSNRSVAADTAAAANPTLGAASRKTAVTWRNMR